MQEVIIFTDGACRGNGKDENIGAYGIILECGKVRKTIRQAFRNTTNNKMELGAVIEALENLSQSCKVNVFSDSKYVCDAINQKWIDSWKKKGWTRGKDTLANSEMWKRLYELLQKHEITFTWVKGHDMNKKNNLCDEMANLAMDNEEFEKVENREAI